MARHPGPASPRILRAAIKVGRRKSPASSWRKCPSHRVRCRCRRALPFDRARASTPISSAMICASVVRSPWPCGDEPMRASTKPEGSMVMIDGFPARRDLHAARRKRRAAVAGPLGEGRESRCRDSGPWRAPASGARGKPAGRSLSTAISKVCLIARLVDTRGPSRTCREICRSGCAGGFRSGR